MKAKKRIKLIIDSNILELRILREIDLLPFEFEYFYPVVDPYHLKKKIVLKLKNLPNYNHPRSHYISRIYERNMTEIVNSGRYNNRFHEIERFDKTTLGPQNFTDEGLVKKQSFVRISHPLKLIKQWNSILYFLKRTYPYWRNHQKDMYVIATAIFAGNGNSTYTLDEKSQFTMFLDQRKPVVVNSEGFKIFVTADKKGFFNKNILLKIEERYKDIRFVQKDQLKVFLRKI